MSNHAEKNLSLSFMFNISIDERNNILIETYVTNIKSFGNYKISHKKFN